MSEAEKRQTRQRAVSIAAVAAAFTVGGPLVGYRFDAQQVEETYRIDAASLNAAIRAASALEGADARLTSGTVAPGTFVNIAYDPQGLRPADANSTEAFAGTFSSSIRQLGQARNEQSELDCLAEAVYYEARSESVLGQRAVAEVVMNRVRHPHYPKTICGVVYQGQLNADTGCQFSFTCDGSLHHKPRGIAWDRARDVALHTMMHLSPPITRKATHYHTDYVDPYWSAGLIETTVIGSHIFYRMPSTRSEWTSAQASLAADQASRAAYSAAAEAETAGIVIEPSTTSTLQTAVSSTEAAAPAAPEAAPASTAAVVATTASVSVSSIGASL